MGRETLIVKGRERNRENDGEKLREEVARKEIEGKQKPSQK